MARPTIRVVPSSRLSIDCKWCGEKMQMTGEVDKRGYNYVCEHCGFNLWVDSNQTPIEYFSRSIDLR